MLIQCAHELSPCPEQYQVATAELSIETLALLGITPESLLAAYAFGMGAVLMPAMIGMAISWAKQLINKL